MMASSLKAVMNMLASKATGGDPMVMPSTCPYNSP
jgi:hypothetical protein